MSGICGIVSFDRSPTEQNIRNMLVGRLHRRGPDGEAHWLDGPTALGHTLLATTPEALLERLPLKHHGSGCVITADARLDNRDELAVKLGVDLGQRTFGDGELILLSYLKWGHESPTSLLGDFAFAIWDPRDQSLFGARDHMGMKQLIYGCPNPRQLYFASDPNVVRDAAPDAFPISEARIVDYLEDLEGIDFTSTFFEGVSRLPPAHCLSFGRAGLRIKRYWQLETGPELTGLTDAEYDEAFLAVFTEAVRCRLRSTGRLGSMLSGGMDSSSVTAIAAGLLAQKGRGPLRTFSVVGPDPDTCPETRSIVAACEMPGIEPHLIDYTRVGDLGPELADALEHLGEPFDGHMNLIRAIYLRASRTGANVMLDGVAGDVVIAGGDARREWMRRGDWRRVWRDAEGERAFWDFGPGPLRACLDAGWRAYVPSQLRSARRAVAARVRPQTLRLRGLVPSDFARRFDPVERYLLRQGLDRQRSASNSPRVASILHPNLTVGRERYDRVAAEVGIEPRDPFIDLRLINFCIALRPAQLQDAGWPKFILRRSMAGRVPDTVRWRQGKEHLGWSTTLNLLEKAGPWDAENLKAALGSRARPEDVDAICAPDGLRLPMHARKLDLIWLALWLNRNASPPGPFGTSCRPRLRRNRSRKRRIDSPSVDG